METSKFCHRVIDRNAVICHCGTLTNSFDKLPNDEICRVRAYLATGCMYHDALDVLHLDLGLRLRDAMDICDAIRRPPGTSPSRGDGQWFDANKTIYEIHREVVDEFMANVCEGLEDIP